MVADLMTKTPRLWKPLAGLGVWPKRPVKPDVSQVLDVAGLPEGYRRLLDAHYQALRAYQPKPYPGRITLFRARIQPLLRWEDFELGWRELATKGIDVRIVPGSHASILTEPHVRVLAQELDGALSRGERKTIMEFGIAPS